MSNLSDRIINVPFAPEVTGGIGALYTKAGSNGDYVYLTYHTSAGDGGHGHFRYADGAAAGTYVNNNGTIIVHSGGNNSAAL